MTDTAPLHTETPLSGGRFAANVMRVGNTVRKPSMPTSAFVARLLHHLDAAGFKSAPRHLGSDDKGRDSFSYIPGTVTERWRPYADEAVKQAAVWLRAFHDATRNATFLDGKAIICHNDPGPNNAVFQNETLVAFIDFDMAAPGHPLEDLGYMAWSWCVSSNAAWPPITTQAAQIRVLLDAYGLDGNDRPAIVTAMMERQSRNVQVWEQRRGARCDPALIPTTDAQIDEIVAWSIRERTFVEDHKDAFLSALT